LSGLFAFPLVWMISFSLRRLDLPPPTQFELFAPPYAFDNYTRVLTDWPLAQFTWNSTHVVLWAVPLTVLTASWAGFAIAQLPRRAQVGLLMLSVALLLVPAPAVWVPRFLIFTFLNLRDTLVPLIAPALMGTSPFYVIMFYIAFARVPRDVYESAQLDGASVWRTWATIGLPLVQPTTIAVALLSFVFHWSNYVDPFLYLHSETTYTLPVGIQLLSQAIKANWPLLMAAATIMAAPVVVVFVIAQRFFLQEQSLLGRWLH
jgi:multiple sugar transport system permease protein